MKDKKELFKVWYANGILSSQSYMYKNFICGIYKSWLTNGQADYICTKKNRNNHGIRIEFEYPENQTLPHSYVTV